VIVFDYVKLCKEYTPIHSHMRTYDEVRGNDQWPGKGAEMKKQCRRCVQGMAASEHETIFLQV